MNLKRYMYKYSVHWKIILDFRIILTINTLNLNMVSVKIW